MTDVFTNQVSTLDLDQMTLGKYTHLAQQFGEDAGHRRFTDAWIAFEDHVQDDRFR